MPRPSYSPFANLLLARLPPEDRAHFLQGCEPVELRLAEVLGEPDQPIRHVYLPTESLISLLKPIEGAGGLEVGLVGNEGMVGTPLILGVDTLSMRAVVQGAGPALRMDAGTFKLELARSTALQGVLKRYVQVVMTQMAQTAACTRFHMLEARLARWLLMTRDRAHADRFHATHEFLAAMLGVRRVGVTKAATALQNRKLIRYHRGDITVVDQSGLGRASCGCYEVDKASYAQIMD